LEALGGTITDRDVAVEAEGHDDFVRAGIKVAVYEKLSRLLLVN
jgi:hypothetical protein